MKWTDDIADYFKKILDKPIGDKDLVIPMDFKYAVKSAPPVKEDEEMVAQPSPWNVRGGINIHIPTVKDTMKYGKPLSASFNPKVPPNMVITASWVPLPTAGGPNTGGVWGANKSLSASYATMGPSSSWATYSTTASYATGFDPSWVGAISGRYVMAPCMDGFLSITVNMGDPSTRKATVAFRNEELTKMVWLNNNVDVVASALVEFNKRVEESSGAGKPWFNCVIKGEGVTYDPKRIGFTGLSYSDCVIKAGLTHHVDIEGQDPMKVLTEIATSYKFFIVGDMDVNEDEGKIEGFIVEELWCINPQTRMSELVFKV